MNSTFYFQVTVLYSLGGHDIAAHSRRMLDKLMSSNLMMMLYNFKGKGIQGKRAFVNLPQISTVMQGNVLACILLAAVCAISNMNVLCIGRQCTQSQIF